MTRLSFSRAAAPAPFFIPGSAGEYFGEVVRTRRAGSFLLRESRYVGGLRMPEHYHPRPYLSYVVRGGLRERSGHGEHSYDTGSLHFHPAGDPHAGCMSPNGVTCLSIIAIDEMAIRLGSASVTPGPASPWLSMLARRCHREAAVTDSASDLALEGLALELIAGLLGTPALHERRVPRWLSDVRDYLHVHFAERIRLADLSALSGVHEVHLVRAFRRGFGATPGAYVRRLRIEDASRALVESRAPIAELALAAGFSSQAHLTRVFHAQVGTTPAAYRRAHARRGR